MQAFVIHLGVLMTFCTGQLLIADEKGTPPGQTKPDSTWYYTIPIDVTLVESKSTMPIDARRAVKLFDQSATRIAKNWQKHLPYKVTSADSAKNLPKIQGMKTVKQRQPLRIHVLGFDKKRVRVVLARHVGNYLWHWYHAVEADLMIERSSTIDDLLGMKAVAEPFTRTIQGIRHGDSKKKVRAILGAPDVSKHTQALGCSFDYYFEENVIIEYRFGVYKIIKGVPEGIKKAKPRRDPKADTP